MRNEFTAIIEPAEKGGFWARCAEVPGANGQGETVEEVLEDLAAAIELMLLHRRDRALEEAGPEAVWTTVRAG